MSKSQIRPRFLRYVQAYLKLQAFRNQYLRNYAYICDNGFPYIR